MIVIQGSQVVQAPDAVLYGAQYIVNNFTYNMANGDQSFGINFDLSAYQHILITIGCTSLDAADAILFPLVGPNVGPFPITGASNGFFVNPNQGSVLLPQSTPGQEFANFQLTFFAATFIGFGITVNSVTAGTLANLTLTCK